MAGYRDNSGYDPYAYEQPGPPLRPYNWVQWTGLVIVVVGGIYSLASLLGQAGLIPLHLKSTQPFASLPLLGILLIHSRRAPGTPAGTEQLRKNRQVLLITVLICAVILGAATVIELTGA
ncbi:hypothetical protein [Sphingomonas flavescens]|uniref:hypothetical protein n=1 Tax=Sphingomonas flavescens TaxID=3132797 RepID=UPI002803A562|nr:hypothetical protein [Sphingomonas limnosediminicola]